MSFWFLIIAAFLSFIGMLFHGVIGARLYMGSIDKSALPSRTKTLSLVSWHMFTIFLFVCTISISYIAFNPTYAVVAYPFIFANLLGAAMFFGLGLGKHKALWSLPGGYLMGLIAGFICAGIA